LTPSPSLVLVDGDIGKQETAAKPVEAAIRHFGTINVLVNNAGIFYTKPFTDFTTEDFNVLVSTNLLGFLYITQLTVKQTLKQKSENVVNISASLADQPVAGVNASVSTVEVRDVVDAVLYLAHADQVTGEVIHVDGGAHAGRW
jgi:NAD(P)-dependent dehydrogenase (short-subunit alcohol dehydrogenase family)